MIHHSVAFRLVHAEGSAEETAFLEAGAALAAIPGVQEFRQWREVSPKNDYRFAFSMGFADEAAYAAYNAHPAHTTFVAERWVPEVAEFQEIDVVAL